MKNAAAIGSLIVLALSGGCAIQNDARSRGATPPETGSALVYSEDGPGTAFYLAGVYERARTLSLELALVEDPGELRRELKRGGWTFATLILNESDAPPAWLSDIEAAAQGDPNMLVDVFVCRASPGDAADDAVIWAPASVVSYRGAAQAVAHLPGSSGGVRRVDGRGQWPSFGDTASSEAPVVIGPAGGQPCAGLARLVAARDAGERERMEAVASEFAIAAKTAEAEFSRDLARIESVMKANTGAQQRRIESFLRFRGSRILGDYWSAQLGLSAARTGAPPPSGARRG